MTEEFFGSVRMDLVSIQKELQNEYLTFKLEGPYSSEETSLVAGYKATVWEIGCSPKSSSACNADPHMALIRAAMKFLEYYGYPRFRDKGEGK